MYKYYNAKFDKPLIDISPGEYHATGDDVVISTVLGSCVSVVIFDQTRKMGGLNHFMLVEGKGMENLGELMRFERYGSYAMESLLNEFIRTGSSKSDLQAKVFGGSRMLKTQSSEPILDIGRKNVTYALSFLKNENIPVLAQDTGGDMPRRLYFFPRTFQVLLKKERGYLDKAILEQSEIQEKKSRIVLFDPELPLG